MSDTILAALIAAVSSSGVTGIILAILNRKWSRSDRREAQEHQEDKKLDAVVAGLKVLTVDRVRYLGQCYIDNHEITLADKENLREMYQAYKELGGNGHLEVVMREVERLPIVEVRRNG